MHVSFLTAMPFGRCAKNTTGLPAPLVNSPPCSEGLSQAWRDAADRRKPAIERRSDGSAPLGRPPIALTESGPAKDRAFRRRSFTHLEP